VFHIVLDVPVARLLQPAFAETALETLQLHVRILDLTPNARDLVVLARRSE
jgi:hypothetical protein